MDPKVENKSFDLILNSILSDSVPSLTVDRLVHAGDHIILLDSREREEFDVSRIAQSRHVGYDHFDPESIADIDKEAKIVVYCAVGYRSEKITMRMKELGFNNVSSLYGGIFEWANQGYEVFNNSGKTDSVHAYNRFWGIWLQKGEKVYGNTIHRQATG